MKITSTRFLSRKEEVSIRRNGSEINARTMLKYDAQNFGDEKDTMSRRVMVRPHGLCMSGQIRVEKGLHDSGWSGLDTGLYIWPLQ